MLDLGGVSVTKRSNQDSNLDSRSVLDAAHMLARLANCIGTLIRLRASSGSFMSWRSGPGSRDEDTKPQRFAKAIGTFVLLPPAQKQCDYTHHLAR